MSERLIQTGELPSETTYVGFSEGGPISTSRRTPAWAIENHNRVVERIKAGGAPTVPGHLIETQYNTSVEISPPKPQQ